MKGKKLLHLKRAGHEKEGNWYKLVVLEVAIVFCSVVNVPFATKPYGKVFHEGDIIVEGNQTFEIKDCEYTQTGNIIVKDRGTLVIQNATLIFKAKDEGIKGYNMTIKNQGNLTAINSVIETEEVFGNDIYFLDNAVAGIRNVTVDTRVHLNSYNNSLINMSDSIIMSDYAYANIFRIYGNSSVHIKNSHFVLYAYPIVYDNSSLWVSDTALDHKIYAYDSSKVKVQHSIMDTYMDCHDHSSIIISDGSILKGGIVCDGSVKVKIWNSSSDEVVTYGWSSAKIFNSVIGGYVGLVSHGYSSIEVLNSDASEVESQHFSSIQLRNSTVSYSVNARDMSAINLLNTTYGWISVEDYAVVNAKWYLTVYATWDSEPLNNASVEVYYVHNGSLADSGFTGVDGSVCFLLPEKVVRSDGTVYLGNYTVMVTYENETREENILLDSSKQTIVVIPEFPSILILPLLIIFTLVAIVFSRREGRT